MQLKRLSACMAVAVFCFIAGNTAHSQAIKTPLLTIEPARLIFDTTFCATTKCAAMVFRNDGDTALEVASASVIGPPFSGNLPVPFTLSPGESRQVEFCYTPMDAPSADSQRVDLVADTRISTSFAFTFDVSVNMMGQLQPGMTYFDGLDSAGKYLIESFQNTATIHDRGAVYWFKSASQFLSVRDFTDDKSALIRALPDTGYGSSVCVYDALSKTLNGIVSEPNQRIVVLVTASPDAGAGTCGPVSSAGVISLANSLGARVFIIGLGSADPAQLGAVADGTGGKYYGVASFQQFTAAFEDIAYAVSQNVAQSFVLRGRGVSPVIDVSPMPANFYAVLVGTKTCIPVRVRNSGDAPLNVKSVSAVTPPFSLEGTLPGVISPGDEATLNVCVEPAQAGFVESALIISGNGCREGSIALPLRAVGYNETGLGHGAILSASPEEFAFDTAYCSVSKCRDITFTNRGDTTAYIRAVDTLLAPFSLDLIAPVAIAPNQTQTFSVCYTPPGAPRTDTASVSLTVDTRIPHSFALLFDVDATMANNRTSDGVPLIEAANYGATDFISSLSNTIEFQDEAAIYSFEALAQFAKRRDFTSSKGLLAPAIPRTATGTASCMLDAIESAIQDLAARSKSKRRVLIVVTDGYDESGCGQATQSSVIDAAIANGVSIYGVGIGISDTSALSAIAGATGGMLRRTNRFDDVIGIYRTIGALVSTGIRNTFSLSGRGVSSRISVDPVTLKFDPTRIGEEQCKDISITNTGNAPLVIDPIADQDSQFVVRNMPAAPIMPGATHLMTVCFRPQFLREQTAEYMVSHNTCGADPIILRLNGVGWDRVNIALNGTWTAKPGSHIQLPITVSNIIPAQYNITNYRLTLSYNKTLLYPDAQPVITTGTMSASLPSVTNSVDYQGSIGRLTIQLSGGLLTSAVTNATLVKLGFTALLGNESETYFDVFVEFENSIPQVESSSAGKFRIDSICYVENRLIDAGGRYSTFMKQNVPNPFNPVTVIEYFIAEPCHARLRVFNRLGAEVRNLADSWHEQGGHTATFDGAGIESGLYFYRLETPQQVLTRKMLLLK